MGGQGRGRSLPTRVVDGRGVAGLEGPIALLHRSRNRLIQYQGALRSTPDLERCEDPDVE
jgi:hypothetical protein